MCIRDRPSYSSAQDPPFPPEAVYGHGLGNLETPSHPPSGGQHCQYLGGTSLPRGHSPTLGVAPPCDYQQATLRRQGSVALQPFPGC
eukprot:2629312-Prorocentrum_lima.AAC.1